MPVVHSNPRSYVIYGSSVWDGSWQAEHNIANALAARHPVLYIDPAVSPLTPFRYGIKPETVRRCRDVVNRGLRDRGRLKVFAPLVLPPIHHPRARAWSLPLVRMQVRRAVRQLRFTDPVVLAWRLLPALEGVAGESLRVGVVMDHPSAGASLMGRDPAELEAETSALCASADEICTTSRPTHALLTERGQSSELVPFGFPADLAPAFDCAAEPGEYAALPRPLLGYTGGVDDRLDYDLIVRLADRFAHGSLVFVGPISPRLTTEAREALASRSNIHLFGLRPRDELPAYVRHIDLAMLPYADNLWTRHQSPVKLWEYLYAGPPILATGCAELRRYQPALLSYAEGPEEALAVAECLLANPSAGRDARRAFALANTWDDRAAQIDALVDRSLRTHRPQPLSRAA
jgi:teichuronic acid biosynthesis glycosyltransferase TuaH